MFNFFKKKPVLFFAKLRSATNREYIATKMETFYSEKNAADLKLWVEDFQKKAKEKTKMDFIIEDLKLIR
jgi:hypothetical protein